MRNFYNFPCESPTLRWICDSYNKLVCLFMWHNFQIVSDLEDLNEVWERSNKLTDISDHLLNLFMESLSISPKMIVELGVLEGESLFIFEKVAKICNSLIVSVDINDCSNVGSYDKWFFVHKNDTDFAIIFDDWCKEKNIKPEIDVLFIDTSHVYEHTCEEINLWFPFLSKKAKVFFHDTNLKRIYLRENYTMGLGWNNKRGVIRALEKLFDTSFNEKKAFTTIIKGWMIKHDPVCNGLTILERLPSKVINNDHLACLKVTQG
jgi:cephalosporin hydroxylase